MNGRPDVTSPGFVLMGCFLPGGPRPKSLKGDQRSPWQVPQFTAEAHSQSGKGLVQGQAGLLLSSPIVAEVPLQGHRCYLPNIPQSSEAQWTVGLLGFPAPLESSSSKNCSNSPFFPPWYSPPTLMGTHIFDLPHSRQASCPFFREHRAAITLVGLQGAVSPESAKRHLHPVIIRLGREKGLSATLEGPPFSPQSQGPGSGGFKRTPYTDWAAHHVRAWLFSSIPT